MKPTRENFMNGKFAIHVKDYKQYLLLILYLNNTGFSTPTYPIFRYSYREDYPYFEIKYGEYSKYLISDATAAQLPVVEFEDFAPVKEFFSIEPINKESETVEKQNKPVLIDANTLTAALYNRFHKDEQISNITMVPLGDVIQFIKDTPATFDMDKVCDKLDDFLNYHYSVEADARPSEIIESCGSITWEELDMPSSYDMSDEAKDEENDIERD